MKEGKVDRDLPFDLVGVIIGKTGAVIDGAEAGGRAGSEEHGFRKGGLSGASVTDKGNVADFLRRIFFLGGWCHRRSPCEAKG